MTPQIVEISFWQLLLGLTFILIAQAVSFVHHLGLNRDITIGTVRTLSLIHI